MYTYTISNSNDITVSIYRVGSDIPVIFQPYYPDGTPFSSEQEASTWAEEWISYAETPSVEDTIGDAPVILTEENVEV